MLCLAYRQIAKEVQNWIDWPTQEGRGVGGLPIRDYTWWLRPKRIFFPGFRHVSLVKISERIGKSIISVLREAQKD